VLASSCPMTADGIFGSRPSHVSESSWSRLGSPQSTFDPNHRTTMLEVRVLPKGTILSQGARRVASLGQHGASDIRFPVIVLNGRPEIVASVAGSTVHIPGRPPPEGFVMTLLEGHREHDGGKSRVDELSTTQTTAPGHPLRCFATAACHFGLVLQPHDIWLLCELHIGSFLNGRRLLSSNCTVTRPLRTHRYRASPFTAISQGTPI
jgi:hypothetical protein